MAQKESQESLFRRLTRLFRSGPSVHRKIRSIDTSIAVPDRTKSSGALLFQKSMSPTYATITSNAYNLSERLTRYQDFQEMEYCLHPDTLIAVPGGYKTIKELSDECSKDPDYKFFVYSYDHNLGRIVPALAKQARQTTTAQSYVVTFDNGKKIIGSFNHRLMKRDGTYCKIEDLKPGDAMMPFYRRDLFNGCKEDGDGYRWIYTMDRRSNMNGWVAEHLVLGELLKGSPLGENEVVHHKNFSKHDNRLSNLEVMTEADHRSFHAKIVNGAKWSEQNSGWIQQFKLNHSRFMAENNPAERRDITFGRILEVSESVGFNLYRLCEALGTDPNVIKRRLRKHGYDNFEVFAKAYDPDWRNHAWDNSGEKNPRYDRRVTFDMACSKFERGMTKAQLASAVGTTTTILDKRIRLAGHKNFTEFSNSYENMKVVSVELGDVLPLYDLTVDGYKNFATDTVISHNTAEIASALDIYADETVAQDDKGRILHIYSDNPKIKSILDDLFYNVLNVEFNLRPWTRNLVKFGDFFLYNDVSPSEGVINAFPIPVNEIEREENYDRADPSAVRFRWVTLGNRVLENWEVTHMRLLGNDMFLPYGSSIIEPARRIWRQLILIEDAMLVYRVVRAPERRVFYIDVGGLPAEAVPAYIEDQKRVLKSSQVIDRQTGRVDVRYNPMSVEEDYFLPVRGGESGTKIDTLAGGQNAAAVEDVQYIQKKLFAALKIPKAYLGYDEALSSKATLAQEDVRFSRTISVIQKTIIAELNKLAIIHLYSHGYDSEDLVNFTLRLSNPSTVAQMQKLELWKSKFEIAAASLGEGMASKTFARKEILGLTDDQIRTIDAQRYSEKIVEAQIEEAKPEEPEGGGGGEEESLGDMLGGGEGGEEEAAGAEAAAETPPEGEEAPPPENAGEDKDVDLELLTSNEEVDNLEFSSAKPKGRKGSPVKVSAASKKAAYNAKRRSDRRRYDGPAATHMPDLYSIATNSDSLSDPHDMSWLKNPFKESNEVKPTLPHDLVRTLTKFSARQGGRSALLSEDFEIGIDDTEGEER